MTLADLVRTLAFYALAEEDKATIRAAYEVLVEGRTTTEAAEKYGLSKGTVRGAVQKMVSKAGNMRVAAAALKLLIDALLSVEWAFERVGKGFAVVYRCRICGAELIPLYGAKHSNALKAHLMRHRDAVADLAEDLLSLLKQIIEERKNRSPQP